MDAVGADRDGRRLLRLRAKRARSPRDRALALTPFYAGTRIAETVRLDVDDVHLSARKGILRVLGKGEKVREIPLHPKLRDALTDWLEERHDWPGANTPALSEPARRQVTAHTLRHTFATVWSAAAST